MTQNAYQTASIFSTIESQFDGYGRQSRSFLSNGQSTNPWYQQDVCYDANGDQSNVSYRYQGSGPGSAKHAPDHLAMSTLMTRWEAKKIAHADSTIQVFTYIGRASAITDENGVKRITQMDGLGRPKIVCEVSSSNLPGSGILSWERTLQELAT